MGSLENFEVVEENYKIYKDNLQYDQLPEQKIAFNASCLELDSYTNLNDIMKEMNEISKKQAIYGFIYESQSRILQQLEDEYNRFFAEKYFEFDKDDEPIYKQAVIVGTKKVKRTESCIEKMILSKYPEECNKFIENLRNEKYKLGLIKRVVSSLDSFSYKLHALKDYNLESNYKK